MHACMCAVLVVAELWPRRAVEAVAHGRQQRQRSHCLRYTGHWYIHNLSTIKRPASSCMHPNDACTWFVIWSVTPLTSTTNNFKIAEIPVPH